MKTVTVMGGLVVPTLRFAIAATQCVSIRAERRSARNDEFDIRKLILLPDINASAIIEL
jgi:hypothetical protein